MIDYDEEATGHNKPIAESAEDRLHIIDRDISDKQGRALLEVVTYCQPLTIRRNDRADAVGSGADDSKT